MGKKYVSFVSGGQWAWLIVDAQQMSAERKELPSPLCVTGVWEWCPLHCGAMAGFLRSYLFLKFLTLCLFSLTRDRGFTPT